MDKQIARVPGHSDRQPPAREVNQQEGVPSAPRCPGHTHARCVACNTFLIKLATARPPWIETSPLSNTNSKSPAPSALGPIPGLEKRAGRDYVPNHPRLCSGTAGGRQPSSLLAKLCCPKEGLGIGVPQNVAGTMAPEAQLLNLGTCFDFSLNGTWFNGWRHLPAATVPSLC